MHRLPPARANGEGLEKCKTDVESAIKDVWLINQTSPAAFFVIFTTAGEAHDYCFLTGQVIEPQTWIKTLLQRILMS